MSLLPKSNEAVFQVPSSVSARASSAIISMSFFVAVDMARSRETAVTQPHLAFRIGAADTSLRWSSSWTPL